MRDEILRKTNRGLSVFEHYIGGAWRKGKKFLNPAYNDTNADCSVRLMGLLNRYWFHDFGDDRYKGDCFAFVGFIYGLNSENKDHFKTVLEIINRDMGLNCISSYGCEETHPKYTLPARPKPRIIEKKKMDNKSSLRSEFNIVSKDFSESELAFWGSYGITEAILERYNVCSLSSFSGVNNEERKYTIRSSEKEPMYGYSNDIFVKIYRPFSSLRFLHGGLVETHCFGFKQLPARGDVVFITGGEKDVLSLASKGFSAITFGSEVSNVDEEIIDALSFRFKHMAVLYDMDSTGVERSKTIEEQFAKYNMKRIELPLSGEKSEKDVSDFFRLGHTRLDLMRIFSVILNDMYESNIKLLRSCEMDSMNPPSPAEDIVSINGVSLGSTGSVLCVTGGEGTGKSNYVAALLAGCLRDKGANIDTLGTTIKRNVDRKAVLLYDTEQSDAQLNKNLTKVKNRAMLSEHPEEFKAFCITSLSRKDRLKAIIQSMDRYYYEFGGIHMVVIDGVADLVRCANDEGESIAVVEELYRLAGIYQTCIVVVLHFVPNGLKLRGHLGSEVQRKAAGILSIEKDKDPAISVVKAVKVRDGSALDVPLMQFSWSKERGMHTYIGDKTESARIARKQIDLKVESEKIFAVHTQLTHTELKLLLQESGVGERTAANYINDMLSDGLIAKDTLNKIYTKANANG